MCTCREINCLQQVFISIDSYRPMWTNKSLRFTKKQRNKPNHLLYLPANFTNKVIKCWDNDAVFIHILFGIVTKIKLSYELSMRRLMWKRNTFIPIIWIWSKLMFLFFCFFAPATHIQHRNECNRMQFAQFITLWQWLKRKTV